MLETLIDDSEFILIKIYNANTEIEQIQTFNRLNMLLSNLDLEMKNMIFTGNFNLFLDHFLDAKGGSPSLKKALQVNYLKLNKSYIFVIYGESKNPKKVQNAQTQICDQTKWEILKYEVHLFTISFSKNSFTIKKKRKIWTLKQ